MGELELLARDHPLNERLSRQLMLALYRSGRQADALHVYREARETFVSQLGIEPGQPLRELEAAILRQDAELAPSVQLREHEVGESIAEAEPSAAGSRAPDRHRSRRRRRWLDRRSPSSSAPSARRSSSTRSCG